MYNTIERNERTRRHHAIILAIGLHLALGAFLYFSAAQPAAGSAQNSTMTSKQVNSKTNTTPQAKTVQMP